MTRGRWIAFLACAAIVGVGSGVALAALRAPHTARPLLPAYHGQATWLPGDRPAPTAGMPPLRGRASLVTFVDPLCHAECPVAGRRLASVLRRLPAASRPTIVLVSVNPRATAGDAARATREWQLAPFRPRWVLGTRAQLGRVWSEYNVAVKPVKGDIQHTLVFYLVDRAGDERTAYLFPFPPAFLQGDLARLAGNGA